MTERSLAVPARHHEELNVKLYPNPAQDYAILQLSKEVTPLQLKITDATGRIIIDRGISTNSGMYIINTSVFSSGLYYVSLYGKEGRLYGGKLSIFKQ